MTETTLARANTLKKEIDQLEKEIRLLPRELLSSTNNKYAERFLRKEYHLRFEIGIFKGDIMEGVGEDERTMKLTDEDLNALIDIRKRKLAELRKELTELQ